MEKVRWGVIGAGGIADKRTMPGMLRSENALLTAIVEVDSARRKELAEKYSVKAYADVESLLKDPRIECVYIASPLRFHREQAMMALDSGKHILLEKPIGLNVAEAREITEYANRSGLIAAAGFMMRFHAIHECMRGLVMEGKLGTLLSCRAQFGGWSEQTNQKWRHNKSQGGGGSLMDMGIHAIDLLGYITGESVAEVAAVNATLAHTFEVEDTSGVLMRLSGGQFAFVDSYFSMPTDMSRIEINGTRATVIADGTLSQEEGGSMKVICGGNLSDAEKKELEYSVNEIFLPADGRYSCYTKEIDAFCRSVREGKPVAVPLCEAVMNQRIIEAAYISEDEHRFVEI